MTNRCLPTCPCHVVGSECIQVAGSGNAGDPYAASWRFDPDETNELAGSPAGLRLLIPPDIGARPAVRALAFSAMSPSPNGFPQRVTFDDTQYDTGGFFDSADTFTFVIPRDGWYTYGAFLRMASTEEGDDRVAIAGQAILYLNDQIAIAQQGPISFLDRGNDAGNRYDEGTCNISGQGPLEAGDRITFFAEMVEGASTAYAQEDRYLYITYRGRLE